VIVLAPVVAREAVGAELACLADMAAEYRFLYGAHPELIYWQFTSLESGVHTSYPGHGGYPSEYDPRQRDWYAAARQHGRLSWIGPYFDASSEQLILTISMPVRWPDGSFAGVTGLDVTVADVVERMKPPPIWSDDARSMLVTLRDREEQRVLEVVARPGYHRKGERWNARFDAEYLDSGDREQMGRLIGDLSSGRSGTCEMPYLGRASLWVYGAVDDRGTYLVLIIPYKEVVAQAVAAEQNVLQRTWMQLRAAGLVAALAMLGALEYRRRTGEGQYIDVSQVEAMASLLGDAVLEYTADGRSPEPMGNRSAEAAPHGIYRCRGDDRWCAIAVFNDEEWCRFCRVLGDPSWSEDSRFATSARRLENADELDGWVERWTIQHTAEEVMNRLQAAGIAAGVVQDARDLVNDPQLRSRGFFVELGHPELGKTVSDAVPIRLSRTQARYRRAAPTAGQDNDYVFRDLLGMSAGDITALRKQGVI